MEDIHNPKRSLREVLPKKGGVQTDDTYNSGPEIPYSLNQRYASRSTSGPRYWLWFFALLIVLSCGYYVSAKFATATVKITPKTANFNVNGQIEATKVPTDSTLNFGTVANITDSESTLLVATNTQKVSNKAKGSVVIYNNFNSVSQKLTIGTRLQTKDGKIYHLDTAVTVPGQKTISGKLTPGSIEVTVTADQAGQDYNTNLVDFTIPGFKGSAKYDKFYARSKSPIIGGLVGDVKIVSEEAKTLARQKLKATLEERIIKQARTQIPKDMVLFNNAIFITYSEEIGTSTETGKVKLIEHANLSGILFNQKTLSQILARKYLTDFDSSADVVIDNWNDLKFNFVNRDAVDISTTDRLAFTLDGKAQLIWEINQSDLRTKLAGKSRNNKTVFQEFPNIVSAEADLSPSWVLFFPTNPQRISVQIVRGI